MYLNFETLVPISKSIVLHSQKMGENKTVYEGNWSQRVVTQKQFCLCLNLGQLKLILSINASQVIQLCLSHGCMFK